MHLSLRPGIKAFLNKANFHLGNKPRLPRYPRDYVNRFIPAQHKAVFIISCDFELAWAWRFSKDINYSLEAAEKIAMRERKNIPQVLKLSEKFSIPITWATVGHLFLENCRKRDEGVHENIPRLRHFENEYWKFQQGDWFSDDPCCGWSEAPAWYAPDLIRQIVDSKNKQEIACHTFSHINCDSKICPKPAMRKEIRECKKAASGYGVELRSFVFPGNIAGNIGTIKEEGFTSYRVDGDVLGLPEKDTYGLWRFPTTAEIGPSPYGWSVDYHIARYKAIIDKAIRHGRVCHFWFHPSADGNFLKQALASLFDFADMRRRDVCLTTMSNYSRFLDYGKF